jgi:hypothetical protein
MVAKVEPGNASPRVRLMRLNALFSGLAAGILLGTGLFVATNWLVLKGGPVVGPHLRLLGEFFIGYDVSFVGSLIGFAYAFVLGLAGGAVIASLYNRLVDSRSAR